MIAEPAIARHGATLPGEMTRRPESEQAVCTLCKGYRKTSARCLFHAEQHSQQTQQRGDYAEQAAMHTAKLRGN